MENIKALKYIDALYFEDEQEFKKFKTFSEHITIGWLGKSSKEKVELIFNKVDEKPKSGILLPVGSLIFTDAFHRENQNIKKEEKNFSKKTVGVYWRDIVFFDNFQIPNELTDMYTEGEIFSDSGDFVVIKNSSTIKIVDKKLKGHHQEKEILYCIIPKSFICSIEYYD